MKRNGRELPGGGEGKLRFIEIGQVPIRVTVRSVVDWWFSHWDARAGASRKCGRDKCVLCREIGPPIIRYVVEVEVAGRRYALELREAQRDAIECLWSSESGGVGAILEIARRTAARRATVSAAVVGWEEKPPPPTDLGRFVAALGLPARVYRT